MTIRAKYSLFTTGLLAAVIISLAAVVTKIQRATLASESMERLGAVMEGVERLGQEAVEGRDELMLISYLMFLQRERPELVFAAVTRRGHTSNLGADKPGLVYLTRTILRRAPVTYTVTAYPRSPAQAPNLSVSPSGVSLNVPGNALVKVSEGSRPDSFVVKLGFLKEKIDAEVDRAVRVLFRRTLAIAGGFMFLGLLGSMVMSKLLTAPLMALTTAVTAMEKGNLDVSVAAAANDEVGALAREFNAMTAHIRELLEFREDILHTLTHELNTPLGGLKGYLELWQEKMPESPSARAEVVQTMSAAVLRMENSLGNALRLFKTASGDAAPGSKSVIWIDAVFHEVRTLYASVAQSKRITVHPLPPEATAFVYADEETLRHVVSNLVSNALKYTPDGGEVRLGLVDAPEEIRFWVSDTGYGMKAEDIPHLFTKFYRAGAGRKAGQRIPGTGLGLNIAKKAVESLGGQIWVESELGKGSTFYVSIPKKQAESGTEAV